MKWILAMTVMALGTAAWAADPPPGKQVFGRYCTQCHAPGFGHPGTQQLALTRGKALSVLEQRKDLAPEYLRYVVRHGLWEMPPYRVSELDEGQLGQLVQYLASGK
jgi:mono/diheme cytochrome c family protein